MALKVAPLNSTFMLISILGFFISVILVYPDYPSWGTAFSLVFVLMFIASMISMTYADVDLELKMDDRKKKKKLS